MLDFRISCISSSCIPSMEVLVKFGLLGRAKLKHLTADVSRNVSNKVLQFMTSGASGTLNDWVIPSHGIFDTYKETTVADAESSFCIRFSSEKCIHES